MKKLLIVIFCLLFASFAGANPGQNMTYEQEKALVIKVINKIEKEVIRTTNWNQQRSYMPEMKKAGNIIKSFGYTQDQYYITTKGFAQDGKKYILSVNLTLLGVNEEAWGQIWVNNELQVPKKKQPPKKKGKKFIQFM